MSPLRLDPVKTIHWRRVPLRCHQGLAPGWNFVLLRRMRTRLPSPLEPTTLKHLESARVELLRLHKVLLDEERRAFEAERGPMGTPGQVLSLVMSDPYFDWLHAISRTIVKFDEMSETSDSNEEQAAALITQAKNLILTKDADSDFSVKYKNSLQKNPAAVLAHAEVLKALRDD